MRVAGGCEQTIHAKRVGSIAELLTPWSVKCTWEQLSGGADAQAM